MVISKSTFGCFQGTITQSKRSQIKHANTLCYTRKYGEQLTRRNRDEIPSGRGSKTGSNMGCSAEFLQKNKVCFSLLFLSKLCEEGEMNFWRPRRCIYRDLD